MRLSVVGGATSCQASQPEAKVDSSQGKGELELALPTGCTGTGVQLKAELMNNQGQPIAPAAASSLTVNIP